MSQKHPSFYGRSQGNNQYRGGDAGKGPQTGYPNSEVDMGMDERGPGVPDGHDVHPGANNDPVFVTPPVGNWNVTGIGQNQGNGGNLGYARYPGNQGMMPPGNGQGMMAPGNQGMMAPGNGQGMIPANLRPATPAYQENYDGNNPNDNQQHRPPRNISRSMDNINAPYIGDTVARNVASTRKGGDEGKGWKNHIPSMTVPTPTNIPHSVVNPPHVPVPSPQLNIPSFTDARNFPTFGQATPNNPMRPHAGVIGPDIRLGGAGGTYPPPGAFNSDNVNKRVNLPGPPLPNQNKADNPIPGIGMPSLFSSWPQSMVAPTVQNIVKEASDQFFVGAGNESKLLNVIEMYLPMDELRKYFNISHTYLLFKVALLLFPWPVIIQEIKKRKRRGSSMTASSDFSFIPNESNRSELDKESDDDDLGKKGSLSTFDLYLPVMAMLTHVILSGFSKGIHNEFHPEDLQSALNWGGIIWISESLVALLVYYIIVPRANMYFLRLISLVGYKFVYLNTLTLVQLMNTVVGPFQLVLNVMFGYFVLAACVTYYLMITSEKRGETSSLSEDFSKPSLISSNKRLVIVGALHSLSQSILMWILVPFPLVG